MRSRLAVLLVVVMLLAGAAVFATLSFDSGERAPGAGGTSPVHGPRGAAGIGSGDSAAGVPEGTIATRTLAAAGAGAGEALADAPTAWLLVIDHTNEQPIAGASVRRVQGGGDVAFTDDRGYAPIPLRDPAQLAVVVDDYLLRLAPTRLGTTEDEPQLVRLVRDRFSLRRRLEFVDAAGAPVEGPVFVRLQPAGSVADIAPPAGDAVLRRAFTEHTMLASRPVCADVPVQLGAADAERVHRLPAAADVRFVARGGFTLEAATLDGLVARAHVDVHGSDAPPQSVRLEPGVQLAGRVVDAQRQRAIAGVEVVVAGGEPLGLVAKTAQDGSFALAPLLPGPVELLLRHEAHEPASFGPVAAPSDSVVAVMKPLPATAVRGAVRARPELAPVAGATIVFQAPGGGSSRAVSGADGTFVVAAFGDAAGRLTVQAPSFQSYAELVEPGAPFATYDLWPAEPGVRLEKGMTALLEGVVLGNDNRPQPNVAVRWHPAQVPQPALAPDRRVLDGGALVLPFVATTGADGAFTLETHAFGPGQLALADDPETSVQTTAVAGRSTNGLRLFR